MRCKRCGNIFDGNFCPMCGTKASENNDKLNPKMHFEPIDKSKKRRKIKVTIVIISSVISVLLIALTVYFLWHNGLITNLLTANDTSKITAKDGEKVIALIEEISSLEESGNGQKEIISFLENIEWIEYVCETEDGGVSCLTEFGVTGVWTPKIENTIGGYVPSVQEQDIFEHSFAATSIHDIDSIAILCPFASVDDDFNLEGYSYLSETMKTCTDCEVSVFEDEDVSLELLKNLDNYDMVWFYSHGALSNIDNSAWAIGDSDPYTMTGEFADSPFIYVLLSDDFFYGRTIIDLSDGRIGVGGNFYKHYYSPNQLDGTFFHFASCNSMRTDKLADALLSRGAEWVEGWTNSVYFNNDYMQFTMVLANLLEGDTISQAMIDADALVKETYDFYQEDCKLTGKGDSNYTIICFYEFNGHRYALFTDKKKWHNAKSFCESIGGHLLTLNSSEEADFITSEILTPRNIAIAIGLTDENVEGKWEWVTNEEFDYSNWKKGEPNNQSSENYALMDIDGTWNDGHLDREEWAYICEWDQ